MRNFVKMTRDFFNLKMLFCGYFPLINSKKYKIAFVIFFMFCCVSAQNQLDKEVEKLYLKSRSLKAEDDFIGVSTQLLKKATEAKNEDKVKYALYTIGQSYFDKGMYSKAIYYCNKVISRSGSDKHLTKMYALRVMSFCYYDLGLTKKAFDANNKALAMTSEITPDDPDQYHLIKGLLYRDKSTYYTDEDSILKYDKRNLYEFVKLKKKFTIAGSLSMPYNNVGYDYLVKKNYDSAWYYYKKAEYYVKKDNDEYNLAYVYQSFGEYYEATNKMDSSLAYFNKSLVSAEKFRSFKLAQAVTDHIREIYLKRGDKVNSVKYDQIFSRLNDSIDAEKKKHLSNVLSSIEDDKDKEIKDSNKTKYWIISSLIFLLIAIVIYSFYQFYKKTKDYQQFKDIIKELENKSSSQLQDQKEEFEKLTTTTISDVKEHELMKKLNTFEKKEQYLSSDTSLSFMASNFNTNVNYLSKVIKKYRENTFNGYINKLRIDYITQKLRTNPEYLNYKIAYLAEECGYSSYTYFVSVFKQQTGITPSKFIEYLSKEVKV